MQKKIVIKTEDDLILAAAVIKNAVNKYGVITLSGELGSGKTALVRKFASIFKIDGVMSPTFNLVHIYENETVKIAHIDLYRITKKEHIEELNLHEIIESADVSFIEWPSLVADMISEYQVIEVKISVEGQNRIVEMKWR